MTLANGAIVLGIVLLCTAILATVTAMPAPPGLGEAVAAEIAQTGVGNPVTAVLLDFRGYDTFLELVVIALAVAGVGALGPVHATPPPLSGPVARAAAAALVPAIILIAGYLLWTGTTLPGGAFQAGALLAGGLVMLEVTGVTPVWRAGLLLRAGAVGGAAAFLAAGLGTLAASGRFLDYPGPDAAYATILAIETAATVSIGVSLAVLLAAERAR